MYVYINLLKQSKINQKKVIYFSSWTLWTPVIKLYLYLLNLFSSSGNVVAKISIRLLLLLLLGCCLCWFGWIILILDLELVLLLFTIPDVDGLLLLIRSDDKLLLIWEANWFDETFVTDGDNSFNLSSWNKKCFWFLFLNKSLDGFSKAELTL